MSTLTPDQQHALLVRNTEEVLPAGALLERLGDAASKGRPLRVKQGFDPTAPDIHLGHTVGLRKLRQFQDLGHQVVLIVGDYTGLVGDPSGRSKTRPRLTPAEIESNSTTYLDQFFRVLEKNPRPPLLPVEIRRNGEWFARMSFAELLELASQYTVARLLERDDFAKRMAAQQPVGVHELLYPLMRGHELRATSTRSSGGATCRRISRCAWSRRGRSGSRTCWSRRGSPPRAARRGARWTRGPSASMGCASPIATTCSVLRGPSWCGW